MKKSDFSQQTSNDQSDKSTNFESVDGDEQSLPDEQPIKIKKEMTMGDFAKMRQMSKRGVKKISKQPNKYSKKWTDDENKRFYKMVQIFSTDFTAMSDIHSRPRNQFKLKFKREAKLYPARIQDALNRGSKYTKLQTEIKGLRREYRAQQEEKSFTKFVRKRGNSFASVDTIDIELVEKINTIKTQH